MRLKGNAKGVDVATLMYENKKIFVRLVAFMKYVEDNFTLLGNSLDVDMEKLRVLGNAQEYVDEEEHRERHTKKSQDIKLFQHQQPKKTAMAHLTTRVASVKNSAGRARRRNRTS
uniref:Uncharacterized protein n=1 Tax=Noctiluca scintillans TaxID=2966 RepID=A0A7S1EWA5_NOCSC